MGESGPVTQTVDMESRRWQARPGVAFVLRAVITIFPFLVALGFSWWARTAYPPERFGLGRLLWTACVWAIAMVVLLSVDRVTRRFLPLAALYKLSLIFPDAAPKRFSVALRTGTTKQLERRIAKVTETGLDPIEQDGAIQLLELVAALGEHDRLTRGHCERVRAYTDLIAEEMGLTEEERSKLHWAALLHDVGKLAVPFEILNSTDKPTESEWRVLKTHTTEGAAIAEPLRPWLGGWVDAVRSHHERWDGDGYPDKLKGAEIPIGARIVAVADAFDVMTSKRSYKEPIPQTEARAEIAECSGGQFDPEVARAFLNVGIGRLRFVMGPLSWLTSLPGAGGTGTATVVGNVGAGVVSAAIAIAASVGVVHQPPTVIAATAEAPLVTTSAVSIPTPTTAVIAETTSSSTLESAPSTRVEPTTTTSDVATTLTTAAATATSVVATTAPSPATTTTTVPVTTTSVPTTLPTTTTTSTTTPPTTQPPAPTLEADDPGGYRWIVGGTSPLAGVQASEPVAFSYSGLPSWMSVTEGADLVSFSPNGLDADDLGERVSIVIRATTDDGRTSDPLTVEIRVANKGLSTLAFQLRINEYADHGSASMPEFVELHNTGSTTANLDGLRLQDYKPGQSPDGGAPGNGNNASFAADLSGITMAPGERLVVWVEGWGTFPGGYFYDPAGGDEPRYLETTGDDLWLFESNGLIVDYTGWYDPAYAGDKAEEFTGHPPRYLGLCPTHRDCRRTADDSASVPGRGWRRIAGTNDFEAVTAFPG